MPQVYSESKPAGQPFPVGAFVRASTLHVGAAAAAASLRRDLVETGVTDASTFDEAYAVARLTPGTNLLAMYTLLGQHLGGWRAGVSALAIGAVLPAAIVVVLGMAYVAYGEYPLAARAMQGARAGALAVFAWAAIRLIRPQLSQHHVRGTVLAVAVLAAIVTVKVPVFILLLAAAGAGAAFLRRPA